MPKPQRKKKHDRITSPGASSDEIRADYLLGPFDQRCREMDLKWGVDRLPDLVSPQSAEIWGRTMGNLNAAIEAQYTAADQEAARADIAACVASCLRGFDHMDAEATRTGAQRADTACFEFKTDEGTVIAIMRDDTGWQALKAQRPDLVIYSMREVANALERANFSNPVVIEAKKRFPSARIKTTTPVDYANGGDPIEM